LEFFGNFMEFITVIDRWLHILAGSAWIGLLYYFNFLQAPVMAAANADTDGPGSAAISKCAAPRALLWSRWTALVTWLVGALYLAWSPCYTFLGTFTLDAASGYTSDTIIGFGAWRSTIALLNVWALVWPGQKKILRLEPATDDEKAKARRTAFLASRINTRATDINDSIYDGLRPWVYVLRRVCRAVICLWPRPRIAGASMGTTGCLR
jgi:uncharacterized membrane protein